MVQFYRSSQTIWHHCFLSNYNLVADMSNHEMNILREFSLDQEVCSIDESLLDPVSFKIKDRINYC